MKNLKRITFVTAVLVLIGVVFSIMAFAKDEAPSFTVDGKNYSSFNDAYEAADADSPIVLQADFHTGSSSFYIRKDVTLDLNGYTITGNEKDENGSWAYNAFTVSSNVSFTITGHGTLDSRRCIINVYQPGAIGNIIGTGSGITIHQSYVAQALKVYMGGELNVSGKVTFADDGTSNACVLLDGTGKLNVIDADISYLPTATFATVSNGSETSISNSNIYIEKSNHFIDGPVTEEDAPVCNLTNTNITYSSEHSNARYLFLDAVYSVVDGGIINLGTATFSYNTHTYSADKEIGILIKRGTLFNKAITCSDEEPGTLVTRGGHTFDAGCSIKPYISPKDHVYYYVVAPIEECGVKIYSHNNLSTAQGGYSYNGATAQSSQSGAAIGGLKVAIKDRWGRLDVRETADGNKYVTYTATAAKGTTSGTPYFYFNLGDIATANGIVTSNVENSMDDVDYYVYDLDITSETGTYPSMLCKTLLYYGKADGTRERPQLSPLNIANSNSQGPYITFGEGKIFLSREAYLWHHITYIVEVAEKRSESKIYVYVDGALLGKVDNAFPTELDDASNYYNGETKYATIGEIRIEESYSADESATFSIDNLTVRTFEKGYKGNENSGLAAFLKSPERSLTECADSIFTADYEFPFTHHIASVNGVPYDNFEEAFSTALAKPGSILTLASDITFDHTLFISDGASITIDLAGYSLLTESNTQKHHTFSVGKNATLNIKSSAPGGKIFNISYKDGVQGGAAIVSSRYENSTVNIDGKNLSTYSAILVDAFGEATSSTQININGGHYYATIKDSYGFIMNRVATAKISVSNAVISLPSGAYLYSTDKSYIKGDGSTTFADCTVLAKTNDTAIINQIDAGTTVSFLGCKLYGSLIPATAESGSYKHGKIVIDEHTLFAGVPTYDSVAFDVPEGYKFAGVDGETLNLTLYYNTFYEIDGKTSSDSLHTKRASVKLNFQTSLVPADAETALVKWLNDDGDVLYTEEFLVGSTASFAGELPVFASGNEWYDYIASSWKGGTKISQADAVYIFKPNLTPTATGIGALQSITLYTGFNMHLYLPAPTHTVSNVVVTDEKGNVIEDVDMQLIDGKAYRVYTLSSNATDLANDRVFNVEFTVTDIENGIEATTISTQITLNVAEYAKTLLDGNYSKATKTLAADMLRYAYECHKMANKTTVSVFAKLIEEYSEYLTVAPNRFGYPREYSALKPYVTSAHFRLGSEADFVFTVSESFTDGMVLKLVWQSVTGETVTKVFEYDPQTSEFSTDGLKIHDVTAVMKLTIEDTNGNVIAMGYYSLSTYINSMASKANVDFAKALYLFSSSAQKYKFPLATKNSVSYSDFGAKGDGVTDDFFSILSTHEFANLNGLKVKADDGATYYIGNNGKCTVNITTDTDWTGAKFIIDDNDISLDNTAASGSNVFEISSSTPEVTYTENSEGTPGEVIASINAAGGIKKDSITHLDLGLGRKALLCVINNTTNHYIRYGANQNNGSAQKEVILVDENGKIDPSTPFMFDYSKITSIVVYAADDDPVTVKGGEVVSVVKVIDVDAEENQDFLHIKKISVSGVSANYKLLKKYTAYARGLRVARSNTTVSGVQHYVEDNGNYGPAYSAFFTASATNNVLFEDCIVTGHRTYYCWGTDANGSYVPMGSYDVSAGNANDVTWKGCVQTNFFHPRDNSVVSTNELGRNQAGGVSYDSQGNVISNGEKYWGIMGSNYSKNLTYDSCKMTRFDAHCGVYNATVINSEISIIALIGGGTFRFENSTMYSNGDAYYLVYLREDYGSTFDGDIIIKDVDWRAERKLTEYAILYAVYTNWNFGYTCHLPTSITVDNLKVSTNGGATTGEDITLTLFREQYINNDYSADEYNGNANLNKTVVPKSYIVANNKAGHIYEDPSSKNIFASMPEGYFSYYYMEPQDTPAMKLEPKNEE